MHPPSVAQVRGGPHCRGTRAWGGSLNPLEMRQPVASLGPAEPCLLPADCSGTGPRWGAHEPHGGFTAGARGEAGDQVMGSRAL